MYRKDGLSVFIRLVLNDLKLLFKSFTIYIFFLILVLFYFTQFNPPSINAPLEPIDEMHFMYQKMLIDYKELINLEPDQRAFMKSVIEKMHQGGLDEKEPITKIKFKLSYEEYDELLEKLNTNLGGNTYYGKALRNNLLRVENNHETYALKGPTNNSSYEEKKDNFDLLIEKQSITEPYGRLFSEYLGITAGFLPVLISAFILTRDRRTQMQGLIYSKNISSLKYVLSKFFAVTIGVLLCYLVLATHMTVLFWRIGSFYGYGIDYCSFYKYTFAWILPTIIFSVSISMFLSIVFRNGIIAVLVQFFVWFSSLMPLYGDYRIIKPIIRYNLLSTYSEHRNWITSILINRIFITVLSIMLVLIASRIFSWRRRNKDVTLLNKLCNK